MGIKYGYARCSTNETKQDIKRQIKDLQRYGVDSENIFLEYESGLTPERTEFKRLLAIVKPGDEINALEVSRLTRSAKQLCDLIEFAREKKIRIVIGSLVVDCSEELDPMTEGMLKMMGVFAEMERNMISARVKSGIANARSKGRLIGRPRITSEDIPQKVRGAYSLYAEGAISKSDCARMCGISRPTLNKYIRIMGE